MMTPAWKSAAACILFALFYAAMAGLFLLALPHPREAIHYMVAGAFACGLSLLAAFVLCAFGRIKPQLTVRTVRRSAPSS